MNTTLAKEKEFFLNYVDTFLQDPDSPLNENIILKRNHSLRVMENSLKIAESLKFSPAKTELAGILGLFHDIGRFKQYRDYNTFSDKDSVYHGDLGIEVLEEEKRFILFTEKEKTLLKNGIHNHGLAKIENGVCDPALTYAKLIRDADKMDIFYIVDAYYKEMLKGKRNIALELGLSNEDEISSKVFEAFMNEQIILKSDMQYINDFKLLQIAWIYDLNFEFTREYVRETVYLNSIISQVSCEQIQEKIREKAYSYLNQ